MSIRCKLFGHKMIGPRHSAVCTRCDYTDFSNPEVNYKDFMPEQCKNHMQELQNTSKESINCTPKEAYNHFINKENNCYFNTKEINEQIKKLTDLNKYCIDIASKIPVSCLQELFDNANKIKAYIESK